MDWHPHVTVATVVERDGRFLLVQEEQDGCIVINQPAGHLERNETLIEAARRETLEETGWHVEILGLLGLGLYTSPRNGVTYYRTSFYARPLRQAENAVLDEVIRQVLWLSPDEMKSRCAELRSPLVLETVHRYLAGHRYPLDMFYLLD